MRVDYTVFSHAGIYCNIRYRHTSTSSHQCQQRE
uniref:Uncharacterized protein n=1 Tax=Arundo donax TaxID=35708 RepID=A0A0A9HHR2_ARUDO